MPTIRSFAELQQAVAVERRALVEHPLYARLATLEDVRVFMQHHTFAVWDFMSLLKSLQRALSCVEVPWIPRGGPVGRRLVNEIVLAEESDEAAGGGYTSHFELYRAALLQAGADVSRIDDFVARIAAGERVEPALAGCAAPEAARHFVLATFATIETRSLPRIAAAFCLGREDVIPDMFVRLVEDLSRQGGGRLTLLRDYLERHIHLDGERHGPMSASLLGELCGDDPGAWREAHAGARAALEARRRFWGEVLAALPSGRAAAHA